MTVEQALGAVNSAEASLEQARVRVELAKKEFGESLRAQRHREAVSLRAVARALGVSASFLSDIERGRRWSDYVTVRIPAALAALRGGDQ